MNTDLETNFKDLDQDLAPSWIELNSRVRKLAHELKLQAEGSALAAQTASLAQETEQLCQHVERIHQDVIQLFEKLDREKPKLNEALLPSAFQDKEEEWARIQSENHELRADFKDVLKALFLWRDEPTNRE